MESATRKTISVVLSRKTSGSSPTGEPVFREVLWSKATQKIQDELWEKLFPTLGREEKLPWWKPSTFDRMQHVANLREFVVHYLGDAVAYDEPPGTSKYLPMHKKVWEVIDQCVGDAGGPASLTIVAYSLGSVIVKDLIADTFHPREEWPRTWPEQLRLENFITLGSPLALYAVQFDKLEDFPAITMQDVDGLWINIYDPQDVIGYPLKKLNQQFGQAVYADKVINAGQAWKFWQWPKQASPLSHTLYWEDKTVAEIVGRKVALDWLRENATGMNLQQEYDEYKSWVKK
jgi:hypothetical protein